MSLIRLKLEQSYVDEINECLKEINSDRLQMPLTINDIGREALAVYKWFVEQTANGKAVVAANRNLTQLIQLCTPQVPALHPRV